MATVAILKKKKTQINESRLFFAKVEKKYQVEREKEKVVYCDTASGCISSTRISFKAKFLSSLYTHEGEFLRGKTVESCPSFFVLSPGSISPGFDHPKRQETPLFFHWKHETTPLK